MIFASVKNAARAARRLHLALQEGGRYSSGAGVTIRRSEACDMIARALGYRDHHHLVNAFGTIDTHPNDVSARLMAEVREVGGHLMMSDLVGEVIPTVREGAPSMDSFDWHYRRDFLELEQNQAFERELANLPPGGAMLLTGHSYSGKSRIAERYAVNMGRNRHRDVPDDMGMSFALTTCGSPADVADRILSDLDDDHAFRASVAKKTEDLRRSIAEMPPRLIVLDDVDSVGIRKGRRSVEALDLVASLISGSKHRWILIGTDSTQNGGSDGVEDVIDRSPALRSLIRSTVELPDHGGDDRDVETVMKSWERSLPIPCKGFFDHADHREELMAVLKAPITIGLVMNGLRDLGDMIRDTPSPSRADPLALIAEMKERRERYERQRDEWRAKRQARPTPSVRRHALVAVPHLLELEPGRWGYDHHDRDVRWEVEAEGTKFTCRFGSCFNTGQHTLRIDAVDIVHDEQSAGVSVHEGVVTLGVGTGVNVLKVDFDPEVVPGWQEHQDQGNHQALRRALLPMWKENRLPEDVRTRMRHIVRLIRDATGAEGVGFKTATAVSRQRLYCQMGPGSQVDVSAIAEIIALEHPEPAWRYGGIHAGGIVPDGVTYWQERPKPPSSRASIESRIRRNLPGCPADLREAILDLHAASSRSAVDA